VHLCWSNWRADNGGFPELSAVLDIKSESTGYHTVYCACLINPPDRFGFSQCLFIKQFHSSSISPRPLESEMARIRTFIRRLAFPHRALPSAPRPYTLSGSLHRLGNSELPVSPFFYLQPFSTLIRLSHLVSDVSFWPSISFSPLPLSFMASPFRKRAPTSLFFESKNYLYQEHLFAGHRTEKRYITSPYVLSSRNSLLIISQTVC